MPKKFKFGALKETYIHVKNTELVASCLALTNIFLHAYKSLFQRSKFNFFRQGFFVKIDLFCDIYASADSEKMNANFSLSGFYKKACQWYHGNTPDGGSSNFFTYTRKSSINVFVIDSYEPVTEQCLLPGIQNRLLDIAQYDDKKRFPRKRHKDRYQYNVINLLKIWRI